MDKSKIFLKAIVAIYKIEIILIWTNKKITLKCPTYQTGKYSSYVAEWALVNKQTKNKQMNIAT